MFLKAEQKIANMAGKRRGILIVIMVLIVAGVPGCLEQQEEAGGEGAAIAMKVGAMPDEATLPYYVAEREGIFAAHGLDVEVVPFMSALERDSAFIAGETDAGENDPVGVLVLRNAGYDIKIVSRELEETPAKMRFAILSSPQSDIRSVADLEGKQLAISSNTVIEWITDTLLGDVQAIKIEEKKVPIRLQLLLEGKYEAATLAEPLASYAIYKGAHLISSDSMYDETIGYTVIVFRGEFIEEHPESVAKFLAAYDEAVDRINANPEQYRERVVEIAKVPEEIASTYQMATYMKAAPYPEESFDQVLSWMERKGLVTEAISYDDVMYNRG